MAAAAHLPCKDQPCTRPRSKGQTLCGHHLHIYRRNGNATTPKTDAATRDFWIALAARSVAPDVAAQAVEPLTTLLAAKARDADPLNAAQLAYTLARALLEIEGDADAIQAARKLPALLAGAADASLLVLSAARLYGNGNSPSPPPVALNGTAPAEDLERINGSA